MVRRKSPHEIAIMREAGRLVAEAHQAVKESIAPGMTTMDLDQLVEEFVKSRGGELVFKNYKGFPGHICASINEEIVHGVPGSRVLEEGDIASIDIGVRYKRYIGDSAMTYPVGQVSPEVQRLLDTGIEALQRGIAAAQPGNRISSIGRAVQEYVEGEGYSVVREYTGHGVGMDMHEEPQVPNFVDIRTRMMGYDLKLKPGLVIAIEPMVNEGTYETDVVRVQGWEVVITKDHKLSVHFEHTVAVTENGPEILTLP